MKSIVIEDIREYIFLIFSVRHEENNIFMDSRTYLGTGFFVSKQGDAFTAGHVIPSPEDIGSDRRLIAITMRQGKPEVCWINKALKFDELDIALIEVNIKGNRYFNLTTEEIYSGTDIQAIGFPSHEMNLRGKEMRVLKGYVTCSHKKLELNFAVPSGMSGSPVFVGDKVAALATGYIRSEEIEDSHEELSTISNQKEIIKITEIRKAIYYGIALPFSELKSITDPALEEKTLFEFLNQQNAVF